MATTVLSNLIDPQVMSDIISAKVTNAIVVTPFAKVDNSLVGVAGSTITVPKYSYIGDATTVGEAGEITDSVLSATPATYTVAKAAKGVTLTDEVLLGAFGNPQGETASQLAKSIASKIDGDCITAMYSANNHLIPSTAAYIGYNMVVEGIDVFNEEMNTEKVMFVNPAQVTTLRKDANFISADKYPHDVIMTGEIGMIANTHIVPTRRVAKVASAYVFAASSTESGALQVVASNAGASEVLLSTVQAAGLYPADVKAGDYVKVAANANAYICPIVKIETDARTEDEVPAVTIYTKRDVTVETERDTHHKTTFISADKHYVAALTNASKVVLVSCKA